MYFQDAIGMVHIKGYMYKWIMQDLGEYEGTNITMCITQARGTKMA